MSSVRLGGLILALLGGAFVLAVPLERIDPTVSPTVASLSLWRAHEACGTFDQAGSIAAHCSTITALWGIGVGAFGLGFLLIVGGLIRFQAGAPRPEGAASSKDQRPAPSTPPSATMRLGDPAHPAGRTSRRRAGSRTRRRGP